ncbi:MAG: hypothetical protein ACRYGF_09035 [Janthinobacterium lividum]
MKIFASEYVWPIVGGLLNGSLAAILYATGRRTSCPWFAAWILAVFFESAVLLGLLRYLSPQAYLIVFWMFGTLEFILQCGVTLEFASKAMRHNGAWIEQARFSLIWSSALAFGLSSALALFARPGTENIFDFYYARIGLFTSDFVFVVCGSTFLIAYRFGTLLKLADFYRFSGFLFWSSVSALTDTMHVYWRLFHHFFALETAHSVLNQVIVIFWVMNTLQKPRPSALDNDGIDTLKTFF